MYHYTEEGFCPSGGLAGIHMGRRRRHYPPRSAITLAKEARIMGKQSSNRREFLKRSAAVTAATATSLAGFPAIVRGQSGPIKVGVLHPVTGPLAYSGGLSRLGAQMAIDEINAAGGVMGKKITPVIEDGASDPPTFAAKAEKLIKQDKVATVFGGWTSASRKAMLPVFESNKGLLFFAIQFEGNECSPNIIYSGAQPYQQILPAWDWAITKNYKKVYLLGSDYV